MSEQRQLTPEETREMWRQIEALRKMREQQARKQQANAVWFALGCLVSYIICHV